MISQRLKGVPRGEDGVYCMFDLDAKPAYAGQTSNLRSRLKQHFIRQDSSVVSYGRLDVWDIAYVDWWTTKRTDRGEQHLLTQCQPYLNFNAEYDSAPKPAEIDIGDPEGTLQLITEDELAFRSRPYNRSKQKLEHILRMIDKIKLADHSTDTRRTLYEHKRIFDENVAKFLGVGDTEQIELTD